jgi:hypothetical protein
MAIHGKSKPMSFKNKPLTWLRTSQAKYAQDTPHAGAQHLDARHGLALGHQHAAYELLNVFQIHLHGVALVTGQGTGVTAPAQIEAHHAQAVDGLGVLQQRVKCGAGF